MNASWDDALLKVEVGALRDLGADLSLIGFSGPTLDRLLDDDQGQAAAPQLGDDFAYDELAEVTRSSYSNRTT